MRVINETTLKFLSKSVNESFARTVVSAFATQIDPTVSEIADIRTAVSEAVTNCVVHAYRGMEGVIDINLKLLEGREIYIKIRDKGCGISNIAKAMEPLYTSAPNEERAGLGFAVMQSFMDKITVKSKVGTGTTITLRKKFAEKKND